ncbi:hypothetical protein [Thiofilum flexile]|uniref:hypothetical protein n=1 Tax=Thiofilum flexile TaxID=125627 RepID=UPI0003791CAA|nr:hypothetical protein [Thiofilum flexile]
MKYKIFFIALLLSLITLPLQAEQLRKVATEIPCPFDNFNSMASMAGAGEPMCEREFKPVCALIKTGNKRFRRLTYTSKCLACSQTKVVSYTLGPCR